MSIFKPVGDLTTFGIGAALTQPGDSFTGHLHSVLLEALPHVSQPVIDDIIRAAFGLLLAVSSRIVYGWLDKLSQKKEEKKKRELPERKPDDINIDNDKPA